MAIQYLLDTNICIYIARNRPPSLAEKFASLRPGTVGISIITFGELCFGAEKSQHRQLALAKLHHFIHLVPVLPLSRSAGQWYGILRFHLERQGTPIGNNDLWIAAHAMAIDAILVSNNTREFARIPQLRLENWVEEASS